MLLRDRLLSRGFAVTVGKPEDANGSDSSAKLNLFLYETVVDAQLRNHRLDEEGPDPLWLVLRYLLTAFDGEEHSDSADAHVLLGRGLVALHELNFLRLDGASTAVTVALEHNPEPLKITFDESTPDLISKLMQGPDETYRLSAAIQVRPVLLLPTELPRYALLVGVDHTAAPPAETEDPVGIEVLPSLGPRLDRVEPAVFEPGEPITVFGADLNLAELEVVLGAEPLQVVGQWPDRLAVIVASALPGPPGGRIAAGLGPSAGELPLRVRLARAGGRYRSSNLLGASLRPVVTAATITAADLVITGTLLGAAADDVVVALYAESTVRTFDVVTTVADQTSLTVTDAGTTAGPGTFLVIVRVNGVQARTSPTVVVT
ncbi:Pvc16 family protein [Kineococcus indalonis]|uniref:Pvc16 family protein n=1 Tax=Kineococcus indalonis TaxID=2696566 RepID=UPI0014120C39|nr:Pvc16 family protein [Kineococcus indalonis]NAZ84893.1 DUF4255 domain-containing protein [Kineococcus indalonis]